jgi:hypothetical protein
MVGVHYMAHHTNLAMQTLINKLHFVHLGWKGSSKPFILISTWMLSIILNSKSLLK